MTDRPTDLSSFPSYQPPRRSLFSARKLALMASVVAGLGVAVGCVHRSRTRAKPARNRNNQVYAGVDRADVVLAASYATPAPSE